MEYYRGLINGLGSAIFALDTVHRVPEAYEEVKKLLEEELLNAEKVLAERLAEMEAQQPR